MQYLGYVLLNRKRFSIVSLHLSSKCHTVLMFLYFYILKLVLVFCRNETRKSEVHASSLSCLTQNPSGETLSAHLDATDGLLSLHHAHVLRRCLVWQQLRRAQVVCSKNDAVDEVLWVTWPWNWDTRQRKVPGVSQNGDHTVMNVTRIIKHGGAAHFNISLCLSFWLTHLPHMLGMKQCSSSTAISRT